MRQQRDPPGARRRPRRADAGHRRIGGKRDEAVERQAAGAADIDRDPVRPGDCRAEIAAVAGIARIGPDIGGEPAPLMRARGYRDADIPAGRIARAAGAGIAAGRLRRRADRAEIKHPARAGQRDAAAEPRTAVGRRGGELRRRTGGRVERRRGELQQSPRFSGRRRRAKRGKRNAAPGRIARAICAIAAVRGGIGEKRRCADRPAIGDERDRPAERIGAGRRRPAHPRRPVAEGVERQPAGDADTAVEVDRAGAPDARQADRPAGGADARGQRHVARNADPAGLAREQGDAAFGRERHVRAETGARAAAGVDRDIAGRGAVEHRLPEARADREPGVGGRGRIARGGDRAAREIIARREHYAVIVGDRSARGHITDIARQQHGQRIVLGNGDHIDAPRLAAARGDLAVGVAGVDDAVGVGGAGVDRDIEQPGVDPDIRALRRDIGCRSADVDRPALLDARRDERDIGARRQRVDRRPRGDLHRRIAARRAAEADLAGGAVQPPGGVDIVGGQHQRPDVEHARRPGDDPARRIEPDRSERIALHRAVERDRLRDRPARHHPVEDGIRRERADRSAEVHRMAGGEEVDRPAARRRRPVDHRLRTVDGDIIDIRRRRDAHLGGIVAGGRLRPAGEGLRAGGRHRPRHRERQGAGARAEQHPGRTGHWCLHGRSCVLSENNTRVAPRSVWKPAVRNGVATVRSSRAWPAQVARTPPPAETSRCGSNPA